MTGLVEEMYDLIEEQLPDVEVERSRVFLHYEGRLWDHPASEQTF